MSATETINSLLMCKNCGASPVTRYGATCSLRCTKMVVQRRIDAEHKEKVRRFWMVMFIVATVGVFVAAAASLGGQS